MTGAILTDAFFPSRERIDLTPRLLHRMKRQPGGGKCPEPVGVVTPTPFSAERAREIIEIAQGMTLHGPWSDNLDDVLTDGEYAYVLRVWASIPSGASTFLSALYAIAEGFDKVSQ